MYVLHMFLCCAWDTRIPPYDLSFTHSTQSLVECSRLTASVQKFFFKNHVSFNFFCSLIVVPPYLTFVSKFHHCCCLSVSPFWWLTPPSASPCQGDNYAAGLTNIGSAAHQEVCTLLSSFITGSHLWWSIHAPL